MQANFLSARNTLKKAGGEDIRCLVVGGEVHRRDENALPKPVNFARTCIKAAKAELTELTDEERDIAIHAAEIMGLGLAGVDIIRSERGPLVLEVNSSPGIEGIEKTTGIDIAGKNYGVY